MMEGPKFPKQESHLNKGVKPIEPHVGTPQELASKLKSFTDDFYSESRHTHMVDFDSYVPDLDYQNFLNAGYQTYVISTLDDFDKFSKRLGDCTALVVAGISKETGENISFLSHQDPKEFLYDKKDDFIRDLKKRLADMKRLCLPGTIDAVIVGGASATTLENRDKTPFKKNYLDSIKLLSAEIKQAISFKPKVIDGPKKISGTDDVYYDNKNRELYFVRLPGSKDMKSFIKHMASSEKRSKK